MSVGVVMGYFLSLAFLIGGIIYALKGGREL